jgi:hypothetical protein
MMSRSTSILWAQFQSSVLSPYTLGEYFLIDSMRRKSKTARGVYPLPPFLAKYLCPLDLVLSITYDNLNRINRLWRKMSRQRT